MGVKFANSAYATLASSITSSATSITLTTGQGARFPSLSGSDYFYATLIDTSNNLEIVKCTARSTDVLTVVRGQESTTARAYSAGDRIELRITAQGIVDVVNTLIETGVLTVPGTSSSPAILRLAEDTDNGSNYIGLKAPASVGSNLEFTLPSADGSSGQYLKTNGSGVLSFDTVSQKVLQTVQLYQSSTQVSVSGEGGTFLSGDFYYPNSLKIGGTFTKQSSSSYLLVWAWYSCWWSSTNTHDFYMWLGSDYRHLGLDPYRMSGNRFNVAAFQCFTGVAAGSRSIYLAGGRGDTNSHTAILNYNPSTQVSTDTSNENTTSQMIVMEIEP